MNIPDASLISVIPLYTALLGLLFIPFTLRVGTYRIKNNILIGDGDDPEMLRRIRGQANFIETVPLALILLIMMELCGAGDTWLHALGALLVFGRIAHYVGLTEVGPGLLRPIGMMSTLLVYLVPSGWLLVHSL
ncbi:glutathione S-transferase [Halieaceae bacterium IMCC14734]|uniref:Glutathione S-transferase n=1 Tax=Candidatus Litorirhabdus singularis TaxID=2518993 RepID=A0ABT3TGX4_9GAMM|nr:MAPEG family protein [Candidatus Litorirhabdus singularis]MCX2981568.1 glutathione S-transferase [Candidatus Litorirhabdus singularis]